MGLTVPGGKMASKRSTPNIPRLDRVKVPAVQIPTDKIIKCLSNRKTTSTVDMQKERSQLGTKKQMRLKKWDSCRRPQLVRD